MKRLLLLPFLLAACEPAPITSAPATKAATMANPASVYCVQQHGKLQIVGDASGQFAYCHLPGGRVVEEWELYHSTH
ncbi:hypothetical protein GALL_546380 [mine drainage metagenome]|uniref:Hemolysin n=1 Tax=mine drainage metagenome TaxID=410659 RepID=A0A1J5PEZ1_9ZZZZ